MIWLLYQAQKEISDLKISVQRLENQLRSSQGSMETRERDYTFAITTRDEVLREKSQLMEKLKDIEEREKKKVGQVKHNGAINLGNNFPFH